MKGVNGTPLVPWGALEPTPELESPFLTVAPPDMGTADKATRPSLLGKTGVPLTFPLIFVTLLIDAIIAETTVTRLLPPHVQPPR